MVAPSGPYQASKCSGSVHICQTRSTGASKVRSFTTASCGPWRRSSWSCPSVRLEAREVLGHPVEPGLPHRAVLLGPGRDLLEWSGVEGARPVLGLVASLDQPGTLQHLDVLDRKSTRLNSSH